MNLLDCSTEMWDSAVHVNESLQESKCVHLRLVTVQYKVSALKLLQWCP